MAIQRLPQDDVVGVTGTAGAFGMSGGELHLPREYTLYYPIGQSLDADPASSWRAITILEVALPPDIRVPWTEETVRAAFVDGADVVLHHAVQFLRQD